MKLSKKHRLLCLILALTTLLLCACTDGTEAPESSVSEESGTSSAPVEESKEAEGWVNGLEDIGDKYAEREFVIVTTNAALFASGGDNLLGKAIDKRRHLVMEKYGVEITVKEKSASDITQGLRDAAANGKKYADLVCAPNDILSSLAAEGLLENMHSLPCIDYEAGYMPKAEIEEQTIGNTMYSFTGSVTMAANECFAVFYNKKAITSMGSDPIELVNSGSWTWNSLYNMAETLAENNKGGIYTTVDDEQLMFAVYNSSGEKIVDEENGAAVSSYNQGIAENTRKIMNELFGNSSLAPEMNKDKVLSEFAAGKVALFVGKIGDIESLEKAKEEWGLLPIPKHSENQGRYQTPVAGTAAAIAVPKNSGDSAFVGTVLNALFAATADSLESALKLTYVNYYFWSNDAAVMLYRVCDRKIYDVGNIYSRISAVAGIGRTVLFGNEDSVITEEALASFKEFAVSHFAVINSF